MMEAMTARRGQPPKGEKALKADINVRLRGKDRERLDQAAKRSGVGPATKARDYILEGLEREERKGSAARK